MPVTVFDGGTIVRDFTRGAGRTVEPPAIAVRDGRIVAEGLAARAMAGDPGAEIVDCTGRVLVPAFGDGHAHPLFGGLESHGPQIRQAASLPELIGVVEDWAAAHPEDAWIVGASYDATLAENGLFDARWLDEAAPDRPVVLRAWDYHTVWANSAALRAAGLDADTPEPALGTIPRRDDGSPLGTLRETGAVELVLRHVPPLPLERQVEALREASRSFLDHGITWVQEAWVDEDQIPAWRAASAAGSLLIRYNLAFRLDPLTWREGLPRVARNAAAITEEGDPHLTAHTVKFFLDGVIENRTAALLSPYRGGDGGSGTLNWSTDELHDAVVAADALGFQLHFHAIGDRATRLALDAVAHVDSVNGPRDRRPVIAHVQLMHPDDLGRFATLGVIANFEPLWSQLDDGMLALTFPHLHDEQRNRQYQIRSVIETGAVVSFGSDWPVTCIDWRQGLDAAITRQTSSGDPLGGWMPQERIDVTTALEGYTRGSAFQAFADDAGEIAVGKRADLVLLDRDPRSADGLAPIAILATWVGGHRHDPRPTDTSSRTTEHLPAPSRLTESVLP